MASPSFSYTNAEKHMDTMNDTRVTLKKTVPAKRAAASLSWGNALVTTHHVRGLAVRLQRLARRCGWMGGSEHVRVASVGICKCAQLLKKLLGNIIGDLDVSKRSSHACEPFVAFVGSN